MSHAEQDGLSHVSATGQAQMVDVSDKAVTARTAQASGRVNASPDVLDAMMTGQLPKGEALNTARVAGIVAAKRTGEWIPLCHPLPVDWIEVEFERQSAEAIVITATVKTRARTGVEMEALTAVSAAALTLYDMGKALDKSMTLGPIQLEHKSGGKSGPYQRQ
ncbi:MAG: cyclic pyranopterin monophosphate synthase MoaC [Phycisphaerae bacterium]